MDAENNEHNVNDFDADFDKVNDLVSLEDLDLQSDVLGAFQDKPFHMIGFKRACVVVTLDRSTNAIIDGGFQGHAITSVYRANDTAVCEKSLGHAVPDPDCTCGFHALKDRDAIEELRFAGAGYRRLPGSSAVLEVELFGSQVIEGSTGFRAASQQVRDVTLDGNCRFCLKPATLVAPGTRIGSSPQGDMFAVDSLCVACADEHSVASTLRFSPVELSASLKAPAKFAPVRDFSKLQRKLSTITPGQPQHPNGFNVWMITLLLAAVMLPMMLLPTVFPSPNIIPNSWEFNGYFMAGIVAVFIFLIVVLFTKLSAMSTVASSKGKIYFSIVLISGIGLISSAMYIALTELLNTPSPEDTYVTLIEPYVDSGDARELLYGVAQFTYSSVGEDIPEDPIDSIEGLLDLWDPLYMPVVTFDPVETYGELSVAFGEEQTGDVIRVVFATPTGEGGCAYRQLIISPAASPAVRSLGGDTTHSTQGKCHAQPLSGFLNGYVKPPKQDKTEFLGDVPVESYFSQEPV